MQHHLDKSREQAEEGAYVTIESALLSGKLNQDQIRDLDPALRVLALHSILSEHNPAAYEAFRAVRAACPSLESDFAEAVRNDLVPAERVRITWQLMESAIPTLVSSFAKRIVSGEAGDSDALKGVKNHGHYRSILRKINKADALRIVRDPNTSLPILWALSGHGEGLAYDHLGYEPQSQSELGPGWVRLAAFSDSESVPHEVGVRLASLISGGKVELEQLEEFSSLSVAIALSKLSVAPEHFVASKLVSCVWPEDAFLLVHTGCLQEFRKALAEHPYQTESVLREVLSGICRAQRPLGETDRYMLEKIASHRNSSVQSLSLISQKFQEEKGALADIARNDGASRETLIATALSGGRFDGVRASGEQQRVNVALEAFYSLERKASGSMRWDPSGLGDWFLPGYPASDGAALLIEQGFIEWRPEEAKLIEIRRPIDFGEVSRTVVLKECPDLESRLETFFIDLKRPFMHFRPLVSEEYIETHAASKEEACALVRILADSRSRTSIPDMPEKCSFSIGGFHDLVKAFSEAQGMTPYEYEVLSYSDDPDVLKTLAECPDTPLRVLERLKARGVVSGSYQNEKGEIVDCESADITTIVEKAIAERAALC